MKKIEENSMATDYMIKLSKLKNSIFYIFFLLFQVDLKTSQDCVAMWKDSPLKTKLGFVKSASLKGAAIC